MKIRIKAHYLETYNDSSKKSIELLVDWDTRTKLRNIVNTLTGFRDDDPTAPKPKSPIHKLGDDNLLTVSIPPIAHYEMNGQPTKSITDLLGNEIEVEIKLSKYQLVSKFESNKGQKIIGVSAKLVRAKTSL
jgi:hypothetical protein